MDNPMNFTQFVYDLWNSSKTTLVYVPDGNHTFDSQPLNVFHTRKVFEVGSSRIFFYFDKASGYLSWVWFEGNDVLMKVRGGQGMISQDFLDSDFKVCSNPTPPPKSLERFS